MIVLLEVSNNAVISEAYPGNLDSSIVAEVIVGSLMIAFNILKQS